MCVSYSFLVASLRFIYVLNRITSVPSRIVCLLRAQKVRQAFSTNHFLLLKSSFTKRERFIILTLLLCPHPLKSCCIFKQWVSALVLNRRSWARSLCDRRPIQAWATPSCSNSNLSGQLLGDLRVHRQGIPRSPSPLH